MLNDIKKENYRYSPPPPVSSITSINPPPFLNIQIGRRAEYVFYL